jgi:hypothetical protein
MIDGRHPDNTAIAAAAATLGQRWRRAALLARVPAVVGGLVTTVGLVFPDRTWTGYALMVALLTTARIVEDRLSSEGRPLWTVTVALTVTAPPYYAVIHLLPAQFRQGLTGGIILAAAEVLALMIYTALPMRPRIPPTAAGTAPPAAPNH